MRGKPALLVVALAMLLGACEAETDEPRPEPAEVTFTSGEATLSVTGEIEDEVTLALTESSEDRLMVFGDGEPRVEIGGDLEIGENRSEDVAVSIAIGGSTFVNELNGTCIVTVTESSDDAIAGELGCPQLQDGEIRISALGTFRAQR